MLLAADVGGTKTLIGLFERAPGRPVRVDVRSYPTRAFPSFTAMLAAFARDTGAPGHLDAEAAVVGVAGPVVSGRALLTNVGWDIAAGDVAAHLGTPRVRILNDVEAMAASVETLTPDEYALIQAGDPRPDGNAAIIAAGTGLGQACLHRIDGRLLAVASEAGHADFAARTDREMAIARMLRDDYGRASVEHVLSGPGILNLHRFTHQGGGCELDTGGEPLRPAHVTRAALAGRCRGCAETLQIFVSAYGAEAGNLALRCLAFAGVYIGGGIAPRILPALQRGDFLDAFRNKPPMTDLLARMPIKVILNAEAALLGAAINAQELE